MALCDEYFGHFVKFVADTDRQVVAIGGEMHADAEALLLKDGSKQSNLWGGGLFPENEPEDRIQYESFINVRPRNDNFSMNIEDKNIRNKVRFLIETLILSPDETVHLLDN
ncbi:MAG: hypothetical protein KAW56_07315 [Candidatus Marinimicrobia bacterium]|nr:hypothetical protein [Candidatus Neomarinimicrobiota bacterium]